MAALIWKHISQNVLISVSSLKGAGAVMGLKQDTYLCSCFQPTDGVDVNYSNMTDRCLAICLHVPISDPAHLHKH